MRRSMRLTAAIVLIGAFTALGTYAVSVSQDVAAPKKVAASPAWWMF